LESFDDFVIVGRLGRRRGVTGEIFVTPDTDFPERFQGMTEIFVRRRTEWVKMKIIASDFIGGRPVLKFEGVDTPEDAARLVNLDLAVPRTQMFELPEGSFYIFDLIDCDVIDTVSEQKVGKIKDVEQFPANDVYVVEKLDGRLARLAATKDFVKEIDIDGKRVLIDTNGMSDDA